MIDWQRGMKDAMWDMFLFSADKGSADNEADKEELKEVVAWLIRATTQKAGYDAKRRGIKDAVDWNEMDVQMMRIVCLAASLCLHGEFGPMPDRIKED